MSTSPFQTLRENYRKDLHILYDQILNKVKHSPTNPFNSQYLHELREISNELRFVFKETLPPFSETDLKKQLAIEDYLTWKKKLHNCTSETTVLAIQNELSRLETVYELTFNEVIPSSIRNYDFSSQEKANQIPPFIPR